MSLANEWIKKNELRLWEDDNFEIELPSFEDNSSVIIHENGIAVISIQTKNIKEVL